MAVITPEEARAYTERWAAVEAFQVEELRRTPMDVKLRQLAALMASRCLVSVDPEREKDVEAVRNRWTQLRGALGG